MRFEDFPFELQRPENIIIDYMKFEIGVFQNVRNGRSLQFFAGPVGQRQQPIVFV